MRRIVLWLTTALLTFTIGVIASALWTQSRHSNVTSRRAYINQDYKWKSPPQDPTGEFDLNYQYSEGVTLLVFYPDGEFASYHGTIYRAAGSSKIELLINEGFHLRKGTWKRNGDDTVLSTSRLASSNKSAESFLAQNQESRVEHLKIRKSSDDGYADEFELNEKIFVPGPHIEETGELLSWPEGH